MFKQRFITNAIGRSSENALDRRRFFTAAGLAGLGAGAAMPATAGPALAHSGEMDNKDNGDKKGPSDSAILNFALNLEYLEAEFYLRAVTGVGLPANMTTGTGTQGAVAGGKAVPFATPLIRKYAEEIAMDEKAHVALLRGALGGAAVSEPAINLDDSFTAAAMAAGLIRTTLYALGLDTPSIYPTVQSISDARDSLDGPTDLDQGIGTSAMANLVPTDANG